MIAEEDSPVSERQSMKLTLFATWMLGLTGAAWGQSPASPAPAKSGRQEVRGQAAVALVTKPFTGDFDAMVQRRLIRVLTPYSKTGYFVHAGVTRGLVYDVFRQFETDLNMKLKTGNLKVLVVMVPTPSNQLAESLLAGKGDIVAASALVTEQRKEQMDFTNPTAKNVSELIVTGPGGPEISSLEDLSGKTLYLGKAWAYWKEMRELSAKFEKDGKPPIKLLEAPESLGPEDLLEMVNAGIVPATAVHDYVAKFWAQVFPKLRVTQAAVKTGGEIAWAIRKDSPKLKAELNAFIAKYPEGSALRSTLLASYLKSTKFAKSSTSREDQARLAKLRGYFQKYGDKYGLDYLLMAAQGYQESTLNQNVKSPVGALGVMQVMPATGEQMRVGDITQAEPNIHAGVKFIRFMMDKYFLEETEMSLLNKGLFTFAAYNAGPARIAQLRKIAAERGLDRNVWFNNVEVVAAEKIGRETVTYVSNIYKYYLGYKLLTEQAQERAKAAEELKKAAPQK
jgi:membrane-bound lytic murein transglycosylase MltF